jgi:hypothetical protein
MSLPFVGMESSAWLGLRFRVFLFLDKVPTMNNNTEKTFTLLQNIAIIGLVVCFVFLFQVVFGANPNNPKNISTTTSDGGTSDCFPWEPWCAPYHSP